MGVINYRKHYTYDDYKLLEGKYDKQGDFSKEPYSFEETFCKISVDFNKTFKRFRK